MGLVRLFLAYVVACSHWQVIVANDHSPAGLTTLGFNAGYAVMFFYIISGFLITFTLTKNYGPGKTLAFYGNRFIRIFSLYWPVVAAIFVVFPSAFAGFLGASAIDQATALLLLGQDWRVSFGSPGGQYFGGTIDLLRQSWTLGAELTFYLFAPFILARPRLAAAILAASLITRAGFVWSYGRVLHDTWTYTFFPSTACFFLLGYFAAKASFALPFVLNRSISWIGGPLLIAIMVFGSRDGFDSLRFWFCVLMFVAILPSLFEATKNSAVLNALGDLSYPLYLTHVAVMVMVQPLIASVAWSQGPFGPRFSLFAFVIFAIVAAALVHYAVEHPMAKALRFIAGYWGVSPRPNVRQA